MDDSSNYGYDIHNNIFHCVCYHKQYYIHVYDFGLYRSVYDDLQYQFYVHWSFHV
jgi:hypothetical protein